MLMGSHGTERRQRGSVRSPTATSRRPKKRNPQGSSWVPFISVIPTLGLKRRARSFVLEGGSSLIGSDLSGANGGLAMLDYLHVLPRTLDCRERTVVTAPRVDSQAAPPPGMSEQPTRRGTLMSDRYRFYTLISSHANLAA